MDRRKFIVSAASAAAFAPAPQSLAQAMGEAILDHAFPGVGETVSGSPREVRLYFTRGVIAASSSVQIKSATGTAIAASRTVNDPSDQNILIVRLKRALPPGTYEVSWHAVSTPGRPSSGTFRFTVS